MINVIRKVVCYDVAENEIQVGDQIMVPIENFGTFTATAEKVTDNFILFIFDDVITGKKMNEDDTKDDGFKSSQLYTWLQEVLLTAFPEYLHSRITELTIPTIGQVVGHNDKWNNNFFESDIDKQLPLMKDPKHRMALFEGGHSRYWLQNTAYNKRFGISFAYMREDGNTYYANESMTLGVRPAFWLVKDKSRDSIIRDSRVSYKSYYDKTCREVTREEVLDMIKTILGGLH